MTTSPDDFEFLQKFLAQRSGLVLSADKTYLVESRLQSVARKHGLKTVGDVISRVRLASEGPLADDVIEAMTVNESFFFRDTHPFEAFRTVILPKLLESRASRRSFRIWCAACSSGQEPYSLAMILKEEAARLVGWCVDIVGTDISKEILDKARAGLYSQFEVQRGMPIQMLVKYFQKQGDLWQIDSAIRAMVSYRHYNLLHDLKGLGTFDVIYCRNVLIYFDQETKAKVLAQISGILADDGLLFLGGAETVLGISDLFMPTPGQRGMYSLTRSVQKTAGSAMPQAAANI